MKTPRWRYALALISLVACVATPGVTLAYLDHANATSNLSTLAQTSASDFISPTPKASFRNVKLSSIQPSTAEPIKPTRTAVETALPLLAVLWIAGVALMSLRLLGGFWSIRRLTLKAEDADREDLKEAIEKIAKRLKIRRTILVKISGSVEVPIVVGLIKSVVILPASFLLRTDVQHLEAILAHELAHVKRLDYLANLAQSIAETVLFYHPVVWWISHVVRIEREHCCDDLAVEVAGSKQAYVKALLRLEEARTRAFKLALAANDGSLLSRVRRLASEPNSSSISPWIFTVLLIGVLVGVGLAQKPAQPKKRLANSSNQFVHIEGRVINMDGKPVKGATVYCMSSWVGVSVPSVKPCVTDGDGRYSFESPDELVNLLVSSKSGFGARRLSNDTSWTIQLAPTHAVPVEAVDTFGHPLVNLIVGPRSVQGIRLDPETFKSFSRKTNASGVAILPNIPADRGVEIGFESPNYSLDKSSQRFPSSGRNTSAKLILSPGCTLTGEITLNGKPVPDIVVIDRDAILYSKPITHTDRFGRYRFESLSAGENLVTPFLTPDLEREWCVAPSLVNLKPGVSTAADFKLIRGALVRCSIKGVIATQSHVNILRSSPMQGQWTPYSAYPVPGQKGVFESHVPPGVYEAGYYNGPGSGGQQRFSVKGEERVDLEINVMKFAAPKEVTCKVLDVKGRLVKGIGVNTSYRDPEGREYMGRQDTDRDGVAHFSMSKAEAATVRFSAYKGNQFSEPQICPVNGVAILHLKPRRLSNLSGVVLGPNGKPKSGVKVSIGFPDRHPFIGDLESMGDWSVKTGPDGRYRFDGFLVGIPVFLMTEISGYVDVQTKPIVTGPTGETVAPAIRIQAGRILAGRVVDQRGVPVQGAHISIPALAQVRFQNVITDSNGRFAYREVPSGPQRIAIWRRKPLGEFPESMEPSPTYTLK